MLPASAWTLFDRSTRPSRRPAADTELTIRRADAQRRGEVERLAMLDSAEPLHGDVLLAELDGRVVAALELDGSRAIADPFARSAPAVSMLRVRAQQLAGR